MKLFEQTTCTWSVLQNNWTKFQIFECESFFLCYNITHLHTLDNLLKILGQGISLSEKFRHMTPQSAVSFDGILGGLDSVVVDMQKQRDLAIAHRWQMRLFLHPFSQNLDIGIGQFEISLLLYFVGYIVDVSHFSLC